MTDTKEQSLEKAKKDRERLYDNNWSVFRIQEMSNYILLEWIGHDDIRRSKKYPFTPPAPEFEKGQIGLDERGVIYFYISRSGARHNVTLCKDKDSCAYDVDTVDTFTPIYQNSPTLERAFETACGELSLHLSNNQQQIMDILMKESKEQIEMAKGEK